MHLYGFDPGQTTGWAHISIHNGEVARFVGGEVDLVGLGDLLIHSPAMACLRDLDRVTSCEIIFVCESFQANPKKMAAPWSSEAIGLIKYTAEHYHVPLEFQSPSQAKSLIKDDHLKKLELWTPGQRHLNDSVLHLVYWLIKKKELSAECLI